MVAKTSRNPDSAVMTTTVPPKATPEKRRKGRPVSGKNDVGRERLLAAAEKLLRTVPPERVTISRIAQEADADPSLVHYYFGNRAALLVAVVTRVTAHTQRSVPDGSDPIAALADHIDKTVRLVRSAPFMHRLMIDEMQQAGNEEARASVRDMNLDLVDFYRDLLHADGGAELADTDPLFLSLLILGASDFFSSAQPLIQTLVPEGTDMDALTTDFQAFLTKIVLDGLRKR